MSTTPINGIGAAFQFATAASPTTFTTLDGTDAISFSGDKVTTNKNTTMASENGVDTFSSSTQDPGSVDIKGFFYPGNASQVALEAIRLAGQAVAMKATYGTSNSVTFNGIVESFTISIPLDKDATFDLKIKITGLKTYA